MKEPSTGDGDDNVLYHIPANDITGNGKDKLCELFEKNAIMKFNIGNGLLDDWEEMQATIEKLALEDGFFSQYFRGPRRFVTPRNGWKTVTLPTLRNEEKAGNLAKLVTALEKTFDMKQGWVAVSRSGYHKPHQDKLTKGATHRIIISLGCYGKTMTFYNL